MPVLVPVVTAMLCCTSPRSERAPLAAALPNDNRTPAGVTIAGVRRIRLVVQRALWHPDADNGPSLQTEAVGEEGKAPMIPAPLIRVPVGATVDANIRNALPDTIIFSVQCGENCQDSIYIAPGATRPMPVRTTAAGTFTYSSALFRHGAVWLGSAAASQSAGAIVVDAPNAPPDRIFVVSEWIQQWDTTKAGDDDRLIMTINGKMWPHTERIHAVVGDTLRWRVVNISGDTHPMHLHGFYFRVDSRGNGAVDSIYTPDQRRMAVTEEVAPFGTFSLQWIPERVGNWIFHCHKAFHMSGFQHADLAEERLDYTLPAPHRPGATDADHAATMMAGLILGIDVAARKPVDGAVATLAGAPRADGTQSMAPRKLRLLAQQKPGKYGLHGYALQRGDSVPALDSLEIPGPPLVLTRGEPVEITVVNHLDAYTGVHWHGIELDSYYDGVAGWSGSTGHLAPRIAPNDSFVVRFTPPRAGSFMYHSHSEEVRQLALGLYGPIVVLDSGQKWDPATDHLVVLGFVLVNDNPYAGVNGAVANYGMRLSAGKTHRLRLMNILVDNDASVSLVGDSGPLTWKVVAKDGADTPVAQRIERAAKVTLGPGETMDVELTPKPGQYQLQMLSFSNVLITINVR